MSQEKGKWKRHLTKALTVVLIFMVCISILQWFLIIALFDFGIEMVKDAMVQQTPKDVKRDDIISTFDRLKDRAKQLPFSFLTGKIKLRKLKAAAEYAIAANDDETWNSEEINTLLRMLNASVGYKQ